MTRERDRYKYFRLEARDLLDAMNAALLDVEKAGASPERLGAILRQAHTLKGASGVVGLPGIATHSHAIEDALEPFRDRSGPVPAEVLAEVHRRLAGIGTELAALASPASSSAPAAASPATTPPVPAEETIESVRIEIAELDRLLMGVVETGAALEHLRRRLATPGGEGERAALDSALDRAVRELAQVRLQATELRLVPARIAFGALEAACLEAARALGKDVRFEATGGDVRLDAHVLAALRPALVHAARNAIDHGIEPRERRALAGKPPIGRVRLSVERAGDAVRWTFEDDGRGVDPAVVAEAARRRRIPVPEGGLSALQAIDMLQAPGFSTATSVTAMSGRGVGLDVLRRTVTGLGGTLSISSDQGRGLRLEAVVPIALSALRVLAVADGERRVAIPLAAVRGVSAARTAERTRTPAGDAVVLGGRPVPLARLAGLLGASPGRTRPSAFLLIEDGPARAALAVEALLGIEEVVVRPVPRLAGRQALVAGASFDEGGTPRLVLDGAGLVEAALRGARVPESGEETRAPPILIVDDSLTTRMLEQSILEAAGYEVDQATSGEEGLTRARQRPYGLFLVDVEMPGMTGLEFLERVRGDPVLSRVPGVLVTTRNSPEDRRRGIEVGARAYIVKSEFDEAFLLATIRGLIGDP